jgi:hypothetical protein
MANRNTNVCSAVNKAERTRARKAIAMNDVKRFYVPIRNAAAYAV